MADESNVQNGGSQNENQSNGGATGSNEGGSGSAGGSGENEAKAEATTKVVSLKEDWTDANGEVRASGTEVELANEVADQLITEGKAEAVAPKAE